MKLISVLFSISVVFVLFACSNRTPADKLKPAMQNSTDTNSFSYLALGDSYTIGESVPYDDCFPAQTVKLLNKTKKFSSPHIVAKTGWTTDELALAITESKIQGTFDFVSLLIGVNNQYRGRDTANYRKEFTELLDAAIKFAGNKTDHVMILSIPDWGVTPFGLNSGRDVTQITKEIDEFNDVAKRLAAQKGISFIDITPHSRTAANTPSLIAGDGLHPSGKMYAYWAQKLSDTILLKIK
jgi:lysophospholipase L1-like esterase